MRKRRGTSRPGQPPFAHEGSLRRGILFAYDRRTESVVASPLGYRRSDVPRVLGFVGPTTMYAFMQAMGLVNDHTKGCSFREAALKARQAFMPPPLAEEKAS